MRKAIGGAFYHAMGLNTSAKVGVVKNTSNKAIKIFSKAVGEQDDKICSLGQLLKGWDFEKGKLDTNQAIQDPSKWLNEDNCLKKGIMKAHAVSMLIGNRDLKNDNIMVRYGSLQSAPIDFGLSCHKVSDLKWLKNKHMHFDTTNMRHEDSHKLFTQDKYEEVLKEVVEEFRPKEKIILQSIYKTAEALRGVGFTSHQYVILVENIQSNVREAEKLYGVVAPIGHNLE